MTVLQKDFGNFYYYIYTYEQPRFRRLAPIQTSNRRDVIHSTRIQDQGDSYSGRIELNSHSDTTVAGINCKVMNYTGRSCNDAPFSDTYEPMTNIPIINAATEFTSTTRRQFILVLNKDLYITDMDHTLINTNQLRHFDTEVQDNPYHATGLMSITRPNDEFMACLQSQGTNVFISTWQPTKTQLSSLPHIVLMSPREWDPHKIEFPAKKYSMQEEIDSRNVSQTNVMCSTLEEQMTLFEEETIFDTQQFNE